MASVNPHLKYQKASEPAPEQLLQQMQQGDTAALSRALTLVESTLPRHRHLAEALIQKALPLAGNSLRIGITGVPGVGKSTFIESLGEGLTGRGYKLAVLAIDPSSAKSKGSILADKTRMEKLSQNKNAFIRPTAAAGSLGGVARRTREAILLCEATGYDVVLVETVGVGQSETAVKYMVDFFMLLMLATTGDELQGIKRGIMEMADLLIIHKADDPNDKQVRFAMGEYKRALHLFPPNANEWIPRVQAASALKNTGMEAVWDTVKEFERQQKLKGYFDKNRAEQALHWFHEALGNLVLEALNEKPKFSAAKTQMEQRIRRGEMEAFAAAHALMEKFF